jgi:hypothetical protein
VADQLALHPLTVEEADLDGFAPGPIQPLALDDVALKLLSSWAILSWSLLAFSFYSLIWHGSTLPAALALLYLQAA